MLQRGSSGVDTTGRFGVDLRWRGRRQSRAKVSVVTVPWKDGGAESHEAKIKRVAGDLGVRARVCRGGKLKLDGPRGKQITRNSSS